MFHYRNEGYVDASIAAGQKRIQDLYGMNKEDVLYTQDAKLPLEMITTTLNQRQTRQQPIIKNKQNRNSVQSALLASRQAACVASGSGDQFDHLTNLAANFDPKSKLRCGWIYNNDNPYNGAGAVGIAEGPYAPTVKGTWMWDVNQAKEKFHTSICRNVQHCQDLDVYPYRGRCGWCATSGKAVPVTNGKVAYPSNPNTACSAESITTTSSACPVATPASQAAQGWSPLPNGNLPRDALISKAQQAGCSDKGTLIQALKSGSDMNYIDVLQPKLAFATYQQRSAVGLNETALKRGNITIGQALSDFQRLNDQASSNIDGALRYAARDLCFNAGEMATFDFCAEVLDSTRGPYTLDCLQKVFLRAGGQKSGTMYPSPSTLSTWNAYPTWLTVKNAIDELKAKTLSQNRRIQEKAIADFYGIPIEKKTLMTPVPGVEIFWFTNIYNEVASPSTLFLGRRIRAMIPFINETNDLIGANNINHVSMVFFTNFSYPSYNGQLPLRVTADDGFGIEFNRPLGIGYKNGVRVNTPNSLVALDYFPPTTFSTSSPWTISSNAPNTVSGLWFQGWGGLYFKLECQKDGIWGEVPAANLSLTQEAFAPMISFQVYREPQNYGADYNFADKRMGAMKMKWTSSAGTPSWSYSTDGPLALPYVNFKENSSMRMLANFKLYSFMTMTMLVTFNAMPNNSVNTQNFITMPGNGVPSIVLELSGTGTYGQGRLRIISNGVASSYTAPIVQDTPYLLSFTVNRGDQTDIYSVNSVSLGIESMNVLQNNPVINYNTNLSFSDPSAYSNPDSGESRTMIVGNSDINVTWIRLYDYYLDTTAITREVRNDWKYLVV